MKNINIQNIIQNYKNILLNTGSILLSDETNIYKDGKLIPIIKCKCGESFTRQSYELNKLGQVYCGGKLCNNLDKKIPHNIFNNKKLLELVEKMKLKNYSINNDKVSYDCNHCGIRYTNNIINNSRRKQPSLCNKCAQLNLHKSDEKLNIHQQKFEEYILSQNSFMYTPYRGAKLPITIKCSKCNTTFETIPNNIYYSPTILCKKCGSLGISSFENIIGDLLTSNGINIQLNNRNIINPKEIDIFIEKYNIGIEIDGLYWHKNKQKEHLYKTELCESKGIQLFHIFDNELCNIETTKIWKSILLNKLGLNQKIYARKTIVKEISSREARDFCIENHLQGYSNSSIRLGLFYEEELVSVMTFAVPRYSKKYQYELIRFCTKTGMNVVGGASKLLKYFERIYKPKSLVSYANRRWSQGNVYEKLGFEFSHNTEPGYFYFLNNKNNKLRDYLISRTQFQKHKLKEMKHYSDERTEAEIMFLEGYDKIYDCGNKVYTKYY